MTMTTDELIGAYLDGELDEATAREIEQLIANDTEARATAEAFRETSALLRAACGEQVYARSAPVRLDLASPRRRLNMPRRRIIYAAAASVAIAAAFGGGMFAAGGFESERDTLISEIAEYHALFARETDHLVEIPAARAEEISSWFGRLLERRLPIPDLSAVGLHFAGGRMFAVDGRPVAQLMYTRDRGLPVAVCLARLEGNPSPVRLDQEGRQRVASWQDGGYGYFVVGEMDSMSARDIADRAAAQLKG
jgi:anti-sigma factor RsiW